MTLREWITSELVTIENDIHKAEITGDRITREFCKGQWNALHHLLQKVENGHFVSL